MIGCGGAFTSTRVCRVSQASIILPVVYGQAMAYRSDIIVSGGCPWVFNYEYIVPEVWRAVRNDFAGELSLLLTLLGSEVEVWARVLLSPICLYLVISLS